MAQKWIKIPAPGQFRGKGEWRKIESADCSQEDWEHTRKTDYLPTAEQDEKPTT